MKDQKLYKTLLFISLLTILMHLVFAITKGDYYNGFRIAAVTIHSLMAAFCSYSLGNVGAVNNKSTYKI